MINTEFLDSEKKGVDIPAGDMQIFDYVSPPLVSGTYKITTTQQLLWDKENINQSYTKDQEFSVSGPRFKLDPADIHSVFPPAAGNGDFTNVLPHIVLNKRTLPWERTTDDKPPENPPVPWMALLVLDETELCKDKETDPESCKIKNTTVEKVLKPGDNILPPQDLKDVSEIDKQKACLAVDIPGDIFKNIIPAYDELPWLTHAREVNMAHKEIFGLNAEGWFSVVVANRFSKPGVKNFVCLVSLEGFKDYLHGGTKKVPEGYSVRMFCLATWNYTAEPEKGENFMNLMAELDTGLLRVPKAPAQIDTDEEKLVKAAFNDGYASLNYHLRHGEKTGAWYRGPFTPVILKKAELPDFFSAEAAAIYNQYTGLFDLSYAVAWQIGRLLALSDRSFSTNMLKWRRKCLRNIDMLLERIENKKSLNGVLQLPDNKKELLDERLIKDKVEEFLTTTFAHRAAPPVSKSKKKTVPLFKACDFTGVLEHKKEYPGIISREEWLNTLASGKSILEELRDKIFNTQSRKIPSKKEEG